MRVLQMIDIKIMLFKPDTNINGDKTACVLQLYL